MISLGGLRRLNWQLGVDAVVNNILFEWTSYGAFPLQFHPNFPEI